MTRPRIVVVGCGGIGGLVAAGLVSQGLAVTALTRNELIADAINVHGFRTRGEMSLGTVRGRAVTALGPGAQFDYALLCTQPPQVEDAARAVASHLADDGAMVVFQNGLCEPRIAEIAGAERVIGGIIAWGATMIEPGLYDRTSSGGFTLGRLDGAADDRLRELAMHLEAIGPVTISDNLMGARWSKMAINCAISALGTVGGDRLGPLMRKRFVRRLALEVMSEVTAVAHAEGVTLEKVAGTLDLDWLELTAAEREASVGSPGLLAKHTLLLAVGTRYRRLRSSMLNAIERGREPAVAFLNGEVVARAERHGLAAPINAALAATIQRIAAGKERSSHETLRRLFDETRAAAVPVPAGGTAQRSVPEDAPDVAASEGDVPAREPPPAGAADGPCGPRTPDDEPSEPNWSSVSPRPNPLVSADERPLDGGEGEA
jgi:2-dehydropantoate 2-reductase